MLLSDRVYPRVERSCRKEQKDERSTVMSMLDELKEMGVNIEDALQRFMNNSALYEKMLGKLVKNVREIEVLPSIEAGDYNAACDKAHTLKGVMGNLSITPLYKSYTQIVNLLRENNPDEAKTLLLETLPVQEKIIACIEKNV